VFTVVITLQNNPMIANPNEPTVAYFAQTRDTLIDTEIYSRFIYSCENNFRRSAFYRGYKCNVMNLGLDRDQNMASITSEMADLELHHHFPTLKQASIMIAEHLLNNKGCVTTFEVCQLLEQAHRHNIMGIIILSKTQHQAYHADPASFISLKQCLGNPFIFIDQYIDGMTLDISYKMLLQLKMEEQYGESFSPNMVKARDQILNWSSHNAYNIYQS
jgi:hypothetical protein